MGEASFTNNFFFLLLLLLLRTFYDFKTLWVQRIYINSLARDVCCVEGGQRWQKQKWTTGCCRLASEMRLIIQNVLFYCRTWPTGLTWSQRISVLLLCVRIWSEEQKTNVLFNMKCYCLWCRIRSMSIHFNSAVIRLPFRFTWSACTRTQFSIPFIRFVNNANWWTECRTAWQNTIKDLQAIDVHRNFHFINANPSRSSIAYAFSFRMGHSDFDQLTTLYSIQCDRNIVYWCECFIAKWLWCSLIFFSTTQPAFLQLCSMSVRIQ